MNYWQLQEPLDAVVFDCDGTLSRCEGINELAQQNGVGDTVETLTHVAMSKTGITNDLYADRLSVVQPTCAQVKALGEIYFNQCVPAAVQVIEILQRIGKRVYIVSAGLAPAVNIFAEYLKIPPLQVYSVDIYFDDQGNYLEFDQGSPLTSPGGKYDVIQDIRKRYPLIMHVGDGMNDVDVRTCVTRFVGYGGVFYRDSIRKCSDFYIQSFSLAPVLALALTEQEANLLLALDRAVYDEGMQLMMESL